MGGGVRSRSRNGTEGSAIFKPEGKHTKHPKTKQSGERQGERELRQVQNK